MSSLIECIINVTRYLEILNIVNIEEKDNVIILQTDNETHHGFTNIVYYLMDNSGNLNLDPLSLINESEIRQWIQYVLVHVSKARNSKNFNIVLKNLNKVLAHKTYLIENSLTIADLLLYYSLVRIMANLSNSEKQTYLHVSRWIDNMQEDRKIRQNNPLINFNKTEKIS